MPSETKERLFVGTAQIGIESIGRVVSVLRRTTVAGPGGIHADSSGFLVID